MSKMNKTTKKFLLFTIGLVLLAIFTSYLFITKDLPSASKLENYTPNLSTKIYDKDNKLIAELSMERRTFVPLADIPLNLQNAFIAIEDNDFYEHWGISTKGILRAASRVFLKRRLAEGGSTITQQLAKTIFLTPEKTLARKIRELIITVQIERDYSKEEIMQFYINQIYFGSGAYGVQSAARIYYNKDVKDLTLEECAMLAAIPKSPNYYNPFRKADAALTRRNLVLAKMEELGYITAEEKELAAAIPLPEKPTDEKFVSGSYFVEFLRIMLEPKYGTTALFKGGMSIYTTLDMKAQAAAEKALIEALEKFDETRVDYFKQIGREPEKVQGALIAVDTKTGAIRAMVGGRDFKETQFNRATQARRQPGSSFKPFVYLAAIESGFTAATILDDSPLIFVRNSSGWQIVSRDPAYLETLAETRTEEDLVDTNKIWMPVNFGGTFRGPVTMRTALSLSINMAAIELITRITPSKVINAARRLGITSPLNNTMSLALGSSDVTLQEMVSAYATFPSGGVKSTPFVITKILDKDGKILEENTPQQYDAISPQEAYIMTNMLRSVVEKGSGWYAKNLGRPAGGKTGTTNESTDAWFIGFTPQLTAGVWVGYDDRTLNLGAKSTGGAIAAPIWTHFMKGALTGTPVEDFRQPANIEWALIDARTGLLALSRTPGAFLEAFISGTAPTQYYDHTSSSDFDRMDLMTEEAGF